MTLRIWQSIPSSEVVGLDGVDCVQCDLKNTECNLWMRSFKTFCTEDDLGEGFINNVIYKEIKKR